MFLSWAESSSKQNFFDANTVKRSSHTLEAKPLSERNVAGKAMGSANCEATDAADARLAFRVDHFSGQRLKLISLSVYDNENK